MAGIGCFGAIGTGIIQAGQIAAAHANGVNVDLTRTLWLGAETHASPPPRYFAHSSYGGRPLELAVYGAASGAARTPAPVLVYVHGGGWGGGSDRVRPSDMRWFVDQGYLVLSVDYSLSSAKQHMWNIVGPQVGCALVWIAGNAARFDGDPSRIALTGEFAGGNIVLTTSYMAAAGSLKPSCAGASPPVGAVIANYPVVDAAGMYRNQDVLAGPFARMMTTSFTGGTPEQCPDQYAMASAGANINAAAPPSLLIVGGSDHLLPAAAAADFVKKAHAAGTDAHLIVVPFAEHSFDLATGSIGSQLVRDATLHFLREHGLGPRCG